MSNDRSLATLDATAQADLVRRGEVKPLELVDAAIERIEELNPRLNAVIAPLFDKARALATGSQLGDGPFRGVPFLLKDMGSPSAGDPFHCGMQVLKDAAWVAERDNVLASRFRAAGLVFLGKTNTPELGVSTTTEPAAYGPTHNPWKLGYSPGGSSGGAAAAVASGMVPIAHATDGGGSIRVPAAHCGLFGLKPSRGRISMGPDIGQRWGGLSNEFVVSRSVRDSASMLDAVHGPAPGDPYFAPLPAAPFANALAEPPGRLRIGILTRARDGVPVHADCVAAAEAAARKLEALGHDVEENHPDALFDAEALAAFSRVIAASVGASLDAWSAKLGRPIAEEDVEPATWGIVERLGRIPAHEYLKALDLVHEFGREMAAWWEGGFDLLLTPTAAEPPPPHGEFSATPEQPLRGLARSIPFSAFTMPYNATGQPAASLPLYWNDAELPIGVQLVAAYAREDLLLRVGAQLERAHPWADRLPQVFANSG